MKRAKQAIVASLALALLLALPVFAQQNTDNQLKTIRIGSKAFTESHILAELAAQWLEHNGYAVERKLGLGGTLIAYQALRQRAIDLYPEYTGTITRTILSQANLPERALPEALSRQQLQLLSRFGFNNTYAIAISERVADEAAILKVSDLTAHPKLRLGFSLEFLNRNDGWPGLRDHYQLPHRVIGMEHALAYRAIETGQLDATDGYSTDGELDAFSLRLLDDDKAFFPRYDAGLLARTDLPKDVVKHLSSLTGILDEKTMRRLNGRVSNDGLKPAEVAAEFLTERQLISVDDRNGAAENRRVSPAVAQRILHNTLVHLKLTAIALVSACLLAIPLALVLVRHQRIARGLVYVAGLFQTIPSLALLALMIPLVGLGQLPAVIALFLYSLLPIIRNTLAGIFGVDPLLKQVATGMGLTSLQQLRKIELPLAMPMILAGIKTAAIISIGTATLAAFVGAGGLGEPIVTGLTLNDHRLILEGAIPAALLAVVAELLFERLERVVVPRHLVARH